MEYKIVTDVLSVLPYGEVKESYVTEMVTKTVIPLLEPTVTDPSTSRGDIGMTSAEYNFALKKELNICTMCQFHGHKALDIPRTRIPRDDRHKNKNRKRILKDKRLMAYRAWTYRPSEQEAMLRDEIAYNYSKQLVKLTHQLNDAYSNWQWDFDCYADALDYITPISNQIREVTATRNAEIIY